jgi:hypothetical protein
VSGKKDIKKLRSRCERAGLRVAPTGREHFAVSLADGSFVTDLPSTPSSPRTLRRKLAELRRAGADPDELIAKRKQQRRARRTARTANHRLDFDRVEEFTPPPIPTLEEVMNNDLVTKLHRAVERDDRFAIGDLSFALISEETARLNRGRSSAEQTVGGLARELGVGPALVSTCRTTSKAWPKDKRRAKVSWAVHRALAAHPERFEVIASKPTWTTSEAIATARSRPNFTPLGRHHAPVVVSQLSAEELAGRRVEVGLPPLTTAGEASAVGPLKLAACHDVDEMVERRSTATAAAGSPVSELERAIDLTLERLTAEIGAAQLLIGKLYVERTALQGVAA